VSGACVFVTGTLALAARYLGSLDEAVSAAAGSRPCGV